MLRLPRRKECGLTFQSASCGSNLKRVNQSRKIKSNANIAIVFNSSLLIRIATYAI
jgi:hypothetical protein